MPLSLKQLISQGSVLTLWQTLMYAFYIALICQGLFAEAQALNMLY